MVGKRAVKSGYDIKFNVARLPTLRDTGGTKLEYLFFVSITCWRVSYGDYC